jgi:hypothetical protein
MVLDIGLRRKAWVASSELLCSKASNMRLTSGRAFRMFVVLKAMTQLEGDSTSQGQQLHHALKDCSCLEEAKGGSTAKE